jgi:hypothetical protein
VTVFPAPAASVPTADPATVDLGQSTTFSTTASLGTGTYTFAWLGLPRGCTGSQATVQCIPEVAGNFSISVKATDSNGQSATSTPLLFSVNPDPVVVTPSGAPGSGLVDAGGNVTFTASASSGSGTFTAYTWLGLPSGCTGTGAAVTCSGTDLPAGTYQINATATDSNGFTSVPSPDLVFLVDQDPTATAPSASRISGDVGQSVTFSASAALGSGSYDYQWLGLPAGCSGSSGDSLSCVLTQGGSLSIQLRVTDSNDASVTSGALAFTVYSDPVANLTANRSAVDVGEPIALDASGTLGAGGFAYAWSGLPTGCSGTTARLNCTPSKSGSYSVRVKITDSNGESASSAAAGIVVAAPLGATVFASSPTAVVGQAIEFTANVADGTGPFGVTWNFGDGGTADGAVVNHTFTAAGTYRVSVRVSDSVGGSVAQTLNITVSGSSSTSAIGGTSAPAELLAIAVLLLAIVAVVAFILFRRRRNADPAPEPHGVAPPEDGPPELPSDAAPESSELPEGGVESP